MVLIKLGVYFFSILIFSSCFVSALDNQSIIDKINSGNSSYCRPSHSDSGNKGPLDSFDLQKIPQFSAMCNVPPPSTDQLKFLLENNVTPILCMGLYDIFQRFCKSAPNNNELKERFPLTVDETLTLFNSFDKSDKFSSLHTFCSTTVTNNTITQSASIDTDLGLWWKELDGQIRSEKLCSSICRTNEEDKVNPLCSYIIWFNSLYLTFEKGSDEPKPSFDASDDQEASSKSMVNKEIVIDSNQIWPSASQNQSTLSSTMSTLLSSTTTGQHSGQLGSKEESPVSVLELNKTNKLQLTKPKSKGQQPISANNNLHEIVTPNTSQSVTLDTETKAEIIPNQVPILNDQIVDKSKEKTPNLKTENENNPSNVKTYDDVGLNAKIEDTYSTSVVTKPVDEAKKTSAKQTSGMVESDVTFEMTPDGMEMEQPSLADKEQQPYFVDEELENGDGDDIDSESEGVAKLAQNKTIPNKSKSITATVNQGINDPDKAYGEEREILIEDHFIEAEDSHFFTYFLCIAVLTIMAYLAFHNKKKLLALAIEGKRTRGSRRRPNSSNYSKLDCSLEEAMASCHTPASVTHVLY